MKDVGGTGSPQTDKFGLVFEKNQIKGKHIEIPISSLSRNIEDIPLKDNS
jgi:hypothetical protein